MNYRGNILFLILLAVGLFAALSYAVTSSVRGDGKNASGEATELDQAVLEGYITNVQNGVARLEFRGCDVVDYSSPENQVSGDKLCHVFHVDGAGVIYQDFGVNNCDFEGIELTDLEIGQACGSVIYFGSLSGKRLYTLSSTAGSRIWSAANTNAPADSATDGKANTDALILSSDTTYPAAELCRSLGSEWYLPAREELLLMLSNGNIGLLSSVLDNDRWYWTSTEFDNNRARRARNFSPPSENLNSKGTGYHIQCIRQ